MNIGLNNDCQKRQQRRAYRRVRLGIYRLRIVNAMLLAEFGALLIHALTRHDLDIGGGRYRTTAISRCWTGISGHRGCKNSSAPEASHVTFSARSTHKTMITRGVPNLAEKPNKRVTKVLVKCCSSSR